MDAATQRSHCVGRLSSQVTIANSTILINPNDNAVTAK